MSEKKVDEEIKNLVLIRLQAMPANMKVYLGSFGGVGRDQLIAHVKKGDSLGKKIVEIQLLYLRSMKDLV